VSPRIKDVAILGSLAAAGALLVAWLVAHGGGVGGGSARVAVPEDAFLVLSVDVRALGASPLAEAVVGKDGGGGLVGGVDAITESCGFNPLFRLREIVAAVPEGGERGDFGVAATGDMSKDELTRCAETLITKRGGRPVVGTAGTFTVVSDAQDASGDTTPKVAFRSGGPFLLGRGAWLTRMIDTVERRVPSIEKSAEHASLRRALQGMDPMARAVVATAVLPASLRDRLKAEMAAEASRGDARGVDAMAGVLGVASAGIALHAGKAGEDTTLLAELRCETDAACAEVKKLIEKQRFAWSRDFGIRLFGLGPLVDNLAVEAPAGERALHVKTRGPTAELARALERALSPSRPSMPRPTPPPSSSVLPTPAPKADEVVHARSSDASSR
jgi:hypothetical protein